MVTSRSVYLAVLLFAMTRCCHGQQQPDLAPEIRVATDGVRLTMVAQHPDVMTPTGIDIDDAGNVWVAVSHTHFRPDDYDGPEHDEIVILSSPRRVFYNKTVATMDLELGSDGWVYLAERDRILRVRDTDGDGVGDLEQDVAVLQTEADYPHNGCSGIAWHPSGDLIFALGENYSKSWTLTGAGGDQITGTGEGGVFRCRPDGSSLRRIAKGFWNPFGICVRSDGTIFAAENDPGSRPPCRLLHVVEGGDYGYQRAYGGAPVHPFVCWDGELRGTLPMLHSLGEAPCGIAPLGAGLVVPSWTDHRIDFYPLSAHGASFSTKRITLVEGGRQFRPTCIVQASPTVFYLTDWVFGSYKLHGYGRVWKLEIDPDDASWLGQMELQPPTKEATLAQQLRSGDDSLDDQTLLKLARLEEPFLVSAAISALARRTDQFDPPSVRKLDAADRITMLLAIRKARPTDHRWVDFFWRDPDVEVQFETLRWIADHRLERYRDDVGRKLAEPQLDYKLFEAALATWNTLSGNPQAGIVDADMLLRRVLDQNASPQTRAFALRLIDPSSGKFSPKVWDQLLTTVDPLLAGELTRSLAASGKPAAVSRLIAIASDEKMALQTRADAIAGLSGGGDQSRTALLELAASSQPLIRQESLRSLRFVELDAPSRQLLTNLAADFSDSRELARAALDPTSIKKGRPAVTDTAAWNKRLASLHGQPDVSSGRRIFFHAKVGLCSNCHRHSGRGNVVGPDLSATSNDGNPDRLLTALLQPSRDVDPQYYPWSLLTDDGQSFTGILLRDGGGGTEFFRDNRGRERKFSTKDIVARKPLTTSMMPDGLIDLMTDREIRDLLAFLDHHSPVGDVTLAKQSSPANKYVGKWWLNFIDGYGGWLDVAETDSGLTASLLWRVGSPRPMASVEMKDGALHLQRGRGAKAMQFVARVIDGQMVVARIGDQESVADQATGRRCPPMPPRPDLAQIKFGPPIELFNGENLDGWKLQPADAQNGWSVQDGVLTNETPKQDFSAYGDFGNLRSERTFGDFKLHIEFNVGAKRNSGIYLRGLYEAQVVDRDSPMQGIAGPGAIFGRIAPSKNAGLPGGSWQTYDLTLVDRHISVVLNGQRVIDNQPVEGCTGGALFGDVTRDGPIYLQGDHTSVQYRNIRLSPRID